MNFFKILFSVCRGTSLFPLLAMQTFKRAFLHLFFLAFLLGVFVCVCRIIPSFYLTSKIVGSIENEFGVVKAVEGKGFVPSISPGKIRQVEIVQGCVLDYFPDNKFSEKSIDIKDFKRGIIWTPGFVTAWAKNPNGGFFLIPLIYTTNVINSFSSDKFTPANVKEMTLFIKEYYDTKGTYLFTDVSQFASTVLFYYLLLIFLLEIGRVLLCVLIFNTLFTGCYSIGGGAAMAGLKYKNLWIIGLYASFPALIIASFFSAFDLPYFDYSTIYLFGFLGYFLFIFSKMQRMRMRNKDDGDDSNE